MMAEGASGNPEQFKGWLYKWTNYIKGYQRRWFVLSNGLLSYYRTQEEMAHTCRGTVNLAGAFIDHIDATHFVVSNGPSQVYHMRAQNEMEKIKWVTTLELAKTQAIKSLESDSEEDGDIEDEPGGGSNDDLITGLDDKLRELTTAHSLLEKNHSSLGKRIGELEEIGGRGAGERLEEQLAMFKLTAVGMVKAANEFMILARNTEKRWSRALHHEHTQCLKLQENFETLAKQMASMEDEAKHRFQRTSTSGSISLAKGDKTKQSIARDPSAGDLPDSPEDDDQFFDAPEMSDEAWIRANSTPAMPTIESQKKGLDTGSVNEAHGLVTTAESKNVNGPVSSDTKIRLPDGLAPSFLVDIRPTLPKRRTAIPPKPNSKLNLWSIMKNCIGKDLSKIPMPVNFNEPLSMLERITEELQYAEILDSAAKAENTLEEMAYVGAFVTSPYATTAGVRANKPFNPLLGETFECDRRAELGWRCLFEQVSHHPPMFAEYAEGRDWVYYQEYTAASKFRGKYLTILPLGMCHLVFHKTKSHYTWCKCVTTVHNIIVGRMWIDQITGQIKDTDGNVQYVMRGYWDQYYEIARVIGGEGKSLMTGPYQTLWRSREAEPGHEVMYGFSHFTASLNEREPGVAPTDCRFRPDQRIMEEGDFPRANEEKVRLEEKQRAKRRKREALAAQAAEAAARGDVEEAEQLKEAATYKPVWFSKEYDPLTNNMIHLYKGGYWEAKQAGDWDKLNLPDLF